MLGDVSLGQAALMLRCKDLNQGRTQSCAAVQEQAVYRARHFWRAQAAEDVGAGWGMMPCSRSIKRGSAQGCIYTPWLHTTPALESVRSSTPRSRIQSTALRMPG